ncbi:MAG: helix-hairpin-helix domain-containing protein [Myxococcaceae bacterium]|nr:helix-hairpin-helix domain-containing protein [Myxococcaceae bacterium]
MPAPAFKISAAARPIVDQLLARATTEADKKKVNEVLRKAAGADGNKVISAAEAQAILDTFKSAAASAGTLDPIALGVEKSAATVASMKELANLDGVSSLFTFQDGSVKDKMIAELNASVARANGRPMEINMLIFEFQSDSLEKALVDIAKKNPNVTIRVIGDSGQATDSGGNALPSILKEKLPNVQVKYKKDFPYIFSQSAGRPVYNHGATQGLNHHKGFVTLIDGKPDLLSTGSFNWSDTADTKNYENLVFMRNTDSSSRRGIESFTDEFAGFWNNPEAALSPNNFANFKSQKWNELLKANGKPPTQAKAKPDDSYAPYSPPLDRSADLNGYRARDLSRLTELVGATLAKAVTKERTTNGRFTSVEDLQERVPGTAALSAETLAALHFGSGLVSVNTASLEELDNLGFSKKSAQDIVKWRETNGDFDSLDQLKGLAPQATLTRLKDKLSTTDVEVFFNSRPFGAPQGGTGYGSSGSRTTPVMGANGQITSAAPNVVVGATDLFNRAKAGQPIDVAMYGMSVGAPEYNALVEAAKRGAVVRVVLNDDYTAPTVAALKALATQGLPIDVRVQKAKTMHEKFGVVGDDIFFGSANFSGSSSTKHSENRITIKNEASTAKAFQGRFDEIWNKSKVM